MKKQLISFIFIFLFVLGTSTISFAATEQDILNFLKTPQQINGVTRKIKDSDIVRAERFFAEHKFTSEEYDQILARMNEILKIMREEGQIDPTSMTWQAEHRVLTIMDEISSITDTTIEYGKTDEKNGYIIIYDQDGKKLDEIRYVEDNFYNSTGSSSLLFLIIGISLIATFGAAIYRKRQLV